MKVRNLRKRKAGQWASRDVSSELITVTAHTVFRIYTSLGNAVFHVPSLYYLTSCGSKRLGYSVSKLFSRCCYARFGYRPVIRVMEMVMESCKINSHNVEMPGARNDVRLAWVGLE